MDRVQAHNAMNRLNIVESEIMKQEVVVIHCNSAALNGCEEGKTKLRTGEWNSLTTRNGNVVWDN